MGDSPRAWLIRSASCPCQLAGPGVAFSSGGAPPQATRATPAVRPRKETTRATVFTSSLVAGDEPGGELGRIAAPTRLRRHDDNRGSSPRRQLGNLKSADV